MWALFASDAKLQLVVLLATVSLLPSPYLFEMGLRSFTSLMGVNRYGFYNIQVIIILLNNLIFDCAQKVKIQVILKSNIFEVGYQ